MRRTFQHGVVLNASGFHTGALPLKVRDKTYAADASRRERMALVTLDPRLVFDCVSSG